MKLNSDCIRDILIAVESLKPGNVYTIPSLHSALPQYSSSVLNYHCLQLLDAGCISANAINISNSALPQICVILDLTFAGHQFLANIRSDDIWMKTKSISKKIGSESLHVLAEISVNVITALLNQQFHQP
jgi:hypothetical protein